MDKRQTEIEHLMLEYEKQCLKDLQKSYTEALADVKRTLKGLLGSEQTLSIVYQVQFQENLQRQLETALATLKNGSITSVSDFLSKTYEDSYLGTIYGIQGQGIPINIGIDHEQMARTINRRTETMQFSQRLYDNVDRLGTAFKSQMSRGIANNSTYSKIAKQLALESEANYRQAMRIVRTEGGRVKSEAKLNSMKAAKDEGADIVKQWDATFDSGTRAEHRYLDGQIKEIGEPFVDSQGREAQAPHKFGIASMDINCRCIVVERARWAVEGEEMPNKVDNETGDLVEAKNYQEWKKKYQEKQAEDKPTPNNAKVFDKNSKDLPNKDDYFKTTSGDLVKIKEVNDYNGIKSVTLENGQTIVLNNISQIRLDNIKGSLKEQHIKNVEDILREAPQEIQEVWNKYADEVKIVDSNYKARAYYSPREKGIHFDQEREDKRSEIMGHAPYETMFHELGHNIDGLASEKYATYNFEKGQTRIASKFNSNKYFRDIIGQEGTEQIGYTLTEMLHKESNDLFNTIEADLKAKAKAAGESARIRKYTVWQVVEKQLKEIPFINRTSLSDIFEATSKGFVHAGAGHGNSYWNEHSVGEEAFAEMFSASITNVDELEEIKRYFPKSYDIFIEIIKGIGR